ncbi:ribonuclease H-like domain-containing protein [Tanacetum coccineum]
MLFHHPHTGLFEPPTLDLSNSGLEEFQQPEFEGYGPKISKSVSENVSNEVRKYPDAPLVEELVSDVDKFEKKTTNCNYHQRERVVSGSNYTRVNYNYSAQKAHPSVQRNMVPRAVLMKNGLRRLNTARPVNTVHPKTTVYSARPMSHFSKLAQSTTSKNLMEDMLPLGEELKEDELLVKEPLKLVLLKVPRKNNMYSVDMKNIVLKESLTCLAEVVNTACYVQNRVLVVKPHNKTTYELFRGRTPSLSFMKPFGCHVTILNTLDHLSRFDGKSDDRFFVGYSLNNKAFGVYNIRTRKVEENLHVRFFKDKPIIVGDGPKWLFDINVLTKSMNYVPVITGTNSNDFVDGSLFDSSTKDASNDEPQPSNDTKKKDDQGGIDDQERTKNSAQDVNTAGPTIETRPLEYPDRNDTAICLELVGGWSFQSFSNRISNSVSI